MYTIKLFNIMKSSNKIINWKKIMLRLLLSNFSNLFKMRNKFNQILYALPMNLKI